MQVETTHCDIINKNTCDNVNCKNKLDESVDSIVKCEGYITHNVNKKKITADGGNYLGVLYEIDIKGETAEGHKETAIFCKAMTDDPIDMGMLCLHNVYKVELFAYKDLFKIINELQDEANISMRERFNTVKCYDESYEQALFMENLTRKGYKTWYRMDVVTVEMAEICIKQLARFHGASFAVQELRPTFFKCNNLKDLKTQFLFHTKEWADFNEKFYKIGVDSLNEDTRNKVGENLRNVLNKYPEYLKEQSTAYCLCHGDYRPNNILIKEKDGKVVDAVPVDYQLVYYSCPVLDFFYFMYMASDYDFRKTHMTYLKNLYYDSLEIYLQYFDISVESMFPRKVFEELYEEKRDYGIMVGFLYYPFLMVAESAEVPDVTKERITDLEFKLDDRYEKRFGDIVEEFIELGKL